MPLTTTVSMLRKAQEQGFAVGAFNVENMEMAQAIISAAEELRAPVILQTTPSTVRYAGTGMYAAMVAAQGYYEYRAHAADSAYLHNWALNGLPTQDIEAG